MEVEVENSQKNKIRMKEKESKLEIFATVVILLLASIGTLAVLGFFD